MAEKAERKVVSYLSFPVEKMDRESGKDFKKMWLL